MQLQIWKVKQINTSNGNYESRENDGEMAHYRLTESWE
jgi:hypothetical protein